MRRDLVGRSQFMLRSERLISSIENVDAAYLHTSFASDAAVGMLIAKRPPFAALALGELRLKLAVDGSWSVSPLGRVSSSSLEHPGGLSERGRRVIALVQGKYLPDGST
jgi:hypothetical protein